MEAFAIELFEKTIFRLPYVADKNSLEKEAKGQTLVSKTLAHIRHNVDQLSGHELDYGIMFLAVNLEMHPWNNHKLVEDAKRLYNQLITKSEELLADTLNAHQCVVDSPRFYEKVHKRITSALRRDTWEGHAATCHLYIWYCIQLKFPSVSDHLDVLLPPSLLLVDSYDDALKVCGVKCLYHIMSESGQAELRWHGRAQVIFDALHKLTYTRQEAVVAVVHSALLKILRVLGSDATASSSGKADAAYQQLLSDMYMEDKLTLRRSYAHSLHLYIQHLETQVVKHLKQTMRVVLNYLEDSCGTAELTRLTILQVVETLIALGQPRINNYYAELSKRLLRLIVDTAMLSMDSDTRDEIVTRAICIFKLIKPEFVGPSLNLLLEELAVQDDRQGRLLLQTLEQIKCELAL